MFNRLASRSPQPASQPKAFSGARRGRYASALIVGILVLGGCSDLPTNYNERAEANFMVGCKDGSSAEYCRCVWAQLKKTVPWKEFDKFDKSQSTAEEENRKIVIPAGIQAAIDKCKEGGSDASPTTTEAQTSTTKPG